MSGLTEWAKDVPQLQPLTEAEYIAAMRAGGRMFREDFGASTWCLVSLNDVIRPVLSFPVYEDRPIKLRVVKRDDRGVPCEYVAEETDETP